MNIHCARAICTFHEFFIPECLTLTPCALMIIEVIGIVEECGLQYNHARHPTGKR